ncbi:Clathrin light chain [Colletotrichum higginsianum IMI 349063]|uniref:Clathrin light chain n=1 Tax=Colletotrichum higginsianum (strain IMI 349063) TaxID=759273 RepID=A0A1B7XVT2_COLHI|nr:Clathrin light chain [Colletotrichum higginsianum IMI 349063]OBR03854.1 Clathrin light chain [Colletotrichum higginsianum IMI 349063]GJD03775.1 clathrin light chain [Colletotrichum higginsianum]
MADRFPSLEDFDSGAQTDIKDSGASPSADDFLAREKALLGEDANQFATAGDSAAFNAGDDDLLGGGGSGNVISEESTFESQFPDLANQNDVRLPTISDFTPGAIPGAGITASSVNYNSGYNTYVEEEEEPAVIREWREKRDAQNEKRAQQFAAQREETIKEARENIDDFYNNYNAKKEKGISQTRKEAEQFLASREDTVSGGTSWERIAKLVDVSGKGAKGGASGSGKERFRELLVSLKKDEKAPGASGY